MRDVPPDGPPFGPRRAGRVRLLRLCHFLVCTPIGMPIVWALANPKIGRREVLASMRERDAGPVAQTRGLTLDEAFAGKVFE